MTIEELFTEEYINLKKENERLKSRIEIMEGMIDIQTKRNSEFVALLYSLKPVIDKNAYSDTKYIYFSNNYIPDSNDNYKVVLHYAKDIKDVKKEEDNENA